MTELTAANWTAEFARELQEACDRIFGEEGAGKAATGIRFSLSIADPGLKDCPLIGISDGFTELCGYEMKDIVGRNCRFLVDPVPKDKVSRPVRIIAKEFCEAVTKGEEYKVPDHLREPYMPPDPPNDFGVMCLQMNARKDGTLFRNMFYMRAIHLNDRPYIIGLQTEVEGEDYSKYHAACDKLDQNMSEVEALFASRFWIQCGMRRQGRRDSGDGFADVTPLNPAAMKREMSPGDLKKPWAQDQSESLQAAVDKVFGVSGAGDQIGELRFSLTIADPWLPECPLIGCSTGFGDLCGYTMDDIVGRNCRFLVDPVPKEMVNAKVRKIVRRFCDNIRDGVEFKLDESECEPWMPEIGTKSPDSLFCAQVNAKKDGTLFENMFYLRLVTLNEHPYIIGLQTGMPPGSVMTSEATQAKEICATACKLLDHNMLQVERCLAGFFWVTLPMRRLDEEDFDDGYSSKQRELLESLRKGMAGFEAKKDTIHKAIDSDDLLNRPINHEDEKVNDVIPGGCCTAGGKVESRSGLFGWLWR
mmetsp:Transcript_48637/g.141766  ORF Transcript_48637/g.141766 Transcript_48637/m.141766 type:complete len:531 (+) Transcript_48637:81-1673(+)